jgi:hypothetical protein
VFERSIVHAIQVLSLLLSDTTPGALRSVKESRAEEQHVLYRLRD